ncbi:hypothetical protein [Klebsiella pneumoniae]|uniref:hypothetical protein n=1 Tax=Klebsiella pneumoniae TaxID=573 RepID=UPI0002A22F77|nr:hypothetical protein [Klebsiella pneumoniae]ELG02196.1 hypothetical protein A1S5_00713 [Escherichia coli KTE48]CAD6055474.1 Uncharacterised protein [Escherichia coli]GCV82421.1 hypothetical protein HmCmsJML058_01632 [Escherichia coli]GDB31463.1 hypothetical protein HmCmsJML195_02598 [Escherichia coli]GDC03028.1 hypothetical protein HmCmsJML208_01205 [Escherichia coli]
MYLFDDVILSPLNINRKAFLCWNEDFCNCHYDSGQFSWVSLENEEVIGKSGFPHTVKN